KNGGSVTLTPGCTQNNVDVITGVTYTYQKNGTGAWIPVTDGKLTLSQNADSGTYIFRATVTGKSQDQIIDSEPVTVNIDTTAPSLTVNDLPTTTLQTSDGTKLYTNTVEVKATGVDEGTNPSGLDKLQYRLNNEGNWLDYTGSVVVTEATPSAATTVAFKAIDKAGNETTVEQTEQFFINTTAPTDAPKITAKLKGTSTDYTSGEWTSNEVVANVDRTSQPADVASYQYKNAKGEWVTLDTTGFTYTGTANTDTTETFTCRAVGYNDTKGPEASITIKIMKTLPDISVTTSPAITDEDGTTLKWVNTDVRFEVKTDSGTKLQQSKDGGATFTDLGTGKQGTLIASDEGKYTYQFKALNAVDAESTPGATYAVWKDSIAPTVPDITISGTPIND
ncbi:MAG: hypothetical protein RR614_13335, partial [Eubacterium sp.]